MFRTNYESGSFSVLPLIPKAQDAMTSVVNLPIVSATSTVEPENNPWYCNWQDSHLLNAALSSVSSFKKAYDSVTRHALHIILIQFGIPMKLVRLIKMCMTETCCKVRVGKYLSYILPVTNGLQQDFLSPLHFNLGLE
jgi:hypothetical protein